MTMFPSEGLSRFASLPPGDRSSTLVRALADIFAAATDHRRDDVHLFEELFLSVYADAAEADRRAAACVLAERADLPASVAAAIGFDVESVAAVFLPKSPAVTSLDLTRIACLRGPVHRRLIAARPRLDRQVVAALLTDREPEVVAALRANRQLRIDPDLAACLDGVAKERAAPTEARIPAPAPAPTVAVTASLPFAANDPAPTRPDAARTTRSALPAPPPPAAQGPAAAIEPGVRPAPGADRLAAFLALDAEGRWTALQSQALQSIGRHVGQRGRNAGLPDPALAGSALFDAAAAKDLAGLATLVAGYLDLPAAAAERIVADPGGEALAVALAALGLDDAKATGILILTGPEPAQGYRRAQALRMLYVALGWRTAGAVLDGWRGRDRIAAPSEPLRQTDPAEGRTPVAAERREKRTGTGEARRTKSGERRG